MCAWTLYTGRFNIIIILNFYFTRDNVKRSDEEEIYIHEAGELKKDPHMLHTSIPLEGVSSLLMDNLPLILVNSLGET